MEKGINKTNRLRRFNNYLSVVVILIALYIMVVPFMPQITWWVQHDSPVHRIAGGQQRDPRKPAPQDTVPKTDALIIPRLGMEEEVHGGSRTSLRLGVWHLPHTSSPDKDGNTVLVGHRFTYAGQAVFYHLDKVQKGDSITLYWGGKRYDYIVSNIAVVPPTQVSVEANTDEPLLTVYTCTPLWTAKNRLVIQATPVEEAAP